MVKIKESFVDGKKVYFKTILEAVRDSKTKKTLKNILEELVEQLQSGVYLDPEEGTEQEAGEYDPLATEEATYAYHWKGLGPAEDGVTEGSLLDLYNLAVLNRRRLAELEDTLESRIKTILEKIGAANEAIKELQLLTTPGRYEHGKDKPMESRKVIAHAYPNKLTSQLKEGLAEDYRVGVFDIQGKKVLLEYKNINPEYFCVGYTDYVDDTEFARVQLYPGTDGQTTTSGQMLLDGRGHRYAFVLMSLEGYTVPIEYAKVTECGQVTLGKAVEILLNENKND